MKMQQTVTANHVIKITPASTSQLGHRNDELRTAMLGALMISERVYLANLMNILYEEKFSV